MQPSPVKQVNVGINTDPFNIHNNNYGTKLKKSFSKLKERGDIKHIHITNSDVLHESFNIGETLGVGSFGKVLEVNDKIENKSWAMKIIPKTLIPVKITALRNEIHILKLVNHPHIILLEKVFESHNRIYLLLEKCTGELGKLFRKSRPFSECDTRIIITQLAGVVDYLHKNDIVHRDLKLENILLAPNPENSNDHLYIKVTDFGLSIIKGACHEMLHDCCGTLIYLSPEIITTDSYSQQCDIWAMGIIMYLLLYGKYPFYAPLQQNLIQLICYNEPVYRDVKVSDTAINLLSKMLIKDPARRITASEIKTHAWIEGISLAESRSKNVLEMMKLWRSDLMLPQGADCDWVTAQLEKTLENGSSTSKCRQNQVQLHKNGKKQSLKIPIHNIEFDRKRKGNFKPQDDLKRRETRISPMRQHANINSPKMNPFPVKYNKNNRDSNANKS